MGNQCLNKTKPLDEPESGWYCGIHLTDILQMEQFGMTALTSKYFHSM